MNELDKLQACLNTVNAKKASILRSSCHAPQVYSQRKNRQSGLLDHIQNLAKDKVSV